MSEIGDFVAHRDYRTKGITTRRARDFFLVTRFIFEYRLMKKTLNLNDLPSDFIDILWGALRRLPNAVLKTQLKCKRSVLEERLREFGKRVAAYPNGRQHLIYATQDDKDLIDTLTRHLVATPAFNDDELFDQFYKTLVRHKLMERKERGLLESQKNAIILFAISCMHGCVIELADNWRAELWASPKSGRDSKSIGVNSFALAVGDKNINVGFEMFAYFHIVQGGLRTRTAEGPKNLVRTH